MYDPDWTLADIKRRKRRRRWLAVGVIVLLILLVNLGMLASLEEPDFTIQSISVDRINIPSHTMFLSVVVSVDNQNGVRAYLLGVEGDIYSGGKRIGSFESDEVVEVSPYTNFTYPLQVLIRNVPLPLSDPVLTVDGKAHLRAWILGITYHFEHQIPLTYNPDQENSPPVAFIDAPRYVRRDRPAMFDGSNSYDPDGKVVGWSWEFGDGQRADGPQVEHSFMASGVYEVRLTVIDQMGEQASTTASVRVLRI